VIEFRASCLLDIEMNDEFGPLEIQSELPCQDCGCHTIFAAVAAPGERSNLFFSLFSVWA